MKKYINIFLLIAILFASPFATFAATSGTIDSDSLFSKNRKPQISGTALDTKIVRFVVYKEDNDKAFFKSKNIKVKNNIWKSKVSRNLPEGKYDIELFGSKNIKNEPIATGTLTIDKNGNFKSTFKSSESTTNSSSTLEVQSVPLLFGGNAKANSQVPISYLQITNTGKEATTINGFWIKQNGSAPDNAIIGLTTVDDKGELRGFTQQTVSPFRNGNAFAPTASNIIFMPGQMRLFTIKAILASDAYLHNTKNLSIDVTGIESTSSIKGMFPIRGTTWTITY